MQAINKCWSAQDWQVVEDSTRHLLNFAQYLNGRVDAGGASLTPDEVTASAIQAEKLLTRLKDVASNYF